MLPVVARRVFGIGADGMGYLYSTFGLGSLFGMVVASVTSDRIRSSLKLIGGILTFAIGLFAFTFATMTGTVQHLVDDRFRGRVMSIYLMALLCFMPFGNVLMCSLSEHFSTSVALRTGAIVTLAATIFLFMSCKEITKAWQECRAEEA